MCVARAYQLEARAARRARAFGRALTLVAIGQEAFAQPVPAAPPPASCACIQLEAARFHGTLMDQDAESLLHAPSAGEREGLARRMAEAESACRSPGD